MRKANPQRSHGEEILAKADVRSICDVSPQALTPLKRQEDNSAIGSGVD